MSFTSTGDRIAKTQIEQMQDGEYKVIGFYDYMTDSLDWKGIDKWPGECTANLPIHLPTGCQVGEQPTFLDTTIQVAKQLGSYPPYIPPDRWSGDWAANLHIYYTDGQGSVAPSLHIYY